MDNGEIDCIWGCFSMDGREQDYQWAGPYMVSRQVIAVNAKSDIYAMGGTIPSMPMFPPVRSMTSP